MGLLGGANAPLRLRLSAGPVWPMQLQMKQMTDQSCIYSRSLSTAAPQIWYVDALGARGMGAGMGDTLKRWKRAHFPSASGAEAASGAPFTSLGTRRGRPTFSEGTARVKAEGKYRGGKPSVPVEEVRRRDRSKAEIAEEFGISRMSIYRALPH